MQIIPFQSAGNIKLSATPDEVRRAMNQKPRVFKRNPESQEFAEEYSHCIVNYNAKGLSYCIEIWSGSKVEVLGIEIFDRPYAEVEAAFKAIDGNLIITGTGFESQKYGIVTYSPVAAEMPDSEIELVSVLSEA